MKTEISVKGMSCGHCKKAVETAVKDLPGVAAAEVSLEKARLAVEFDEKKTSLEEIKTAVVNAGYEPG